MKKMVFIPIVIMLVLGGCTNVRQTIDDDHYIKEIAITFTANFALTSDGNVLSWGTNEYGVLGLGDIGHISTPQIVEIGEPVQKIVTSSLANTVFAITESGNVYGWGSNKYKVISSDDVPEYHSPVLVDFEMPVSDLKLSHYLVTAMGMDGKIYGYGWTQEGSSIHIEEGESFLASDNNIKEIPLSNNEPVVQFENSAIYRAFLNTKGDVFVQGALIEEAVNFEQAEHIPFPEPIIQIGTMYQGLVVLSETGKLYFIGEDRFGIVGDDSSEYYDTYTEPVLIDKINETVQNISVSSSSIIAQTNNGDIYTWGYNLGKNDADTDEEVVITPNKLDFSDTVRYYYCGEFSSACITKDNEVYVWGSNVYSLYMDDERESTYTPTKLDFSNYL